MKVPVTVIIPTLNCRVKLKRHLDGIEDWLPLAGEVIAVDSNSSDGTKELLEKRLNPYGAKIISTRPGLYQAWNLAAANATQPYVYYSTVCDIIGKKEFLELTSLIINSNTDVIISPPKIVSYDGINMENIKWPIHYVLKYLNFHKGITILDDLQKQYMVSVFFPASIIGSSASNLYRTEVIKENPFPSDVGSVGDTFWALRNIPSLKVGIAEKEYATFCWDGVRNGEWDESGEITAKFRNESIKLDHGPHTIGYINDRILEECLQLRAYVRCIERPLVLKIKDTVLTYTSVRFWFNKIVARIKFSK